MSGIAELLINLGYKVSGSDLKKSPVIGRLSDLGGGNFHQSWKGKHKRGRCSGLLLRGIR